MRKTQVKAALRISLVMVDQICTRDTGAVKRKLQAIWLKKFAVF